MTLKRKPGLILLDQIRTVDRVRLVKKEGAIADRTMLDLRTLQEVFPEQEQAMVRFCVKDQPSSSILPISITT